VISQIRIDDDWRQAILKAIANESPKPDQTLEIKRVESAMENLKKQHLWGAVTDEAFKSQYREFQIQLSRLNQEAEADASLGPDLERAGQLLKNLPVLWQHPGVTNEQRRDFAREVFNKVVLSSGKI